MKVTTKSLAAELDLSHATVSMALRDHPLINKETRKRVQALAHKLNYTPNAIARAMRSSVSHTLGIIVGTMRDAFTAEVVEGIESAAKLEDYQCMLCQSHDAVEPSRKEIAMLAERRVDGLIIQPFNVFNDPELVRILESYRIPFVFYNGEVAGATGRCVGSDDAVIGRLPTEHLIALGHRQIACITGPIETLSAKVRYNGFLETLKKARIRLDKGLVVHQGWFLEDGVAAIDALFERKKSFTAVVASSDYCAIGVVKALKKRGLRVPEDISVTGAGNYWDSALFEPALTTVDQNAREIGRLATRLLFDQLKSPVTRQGNEIVGCRLVERSSTRAIAS